MFLGIILLNLSTLVGEKSYGLFSIGIMVLLGAGPVVARRLPHVTLDEETRNPVMMCPGTSRV
ncbi:hypothetical protein CIK75_11150 [Glutamicibacter sp. BW78]|uniref:hypothetical protein n=1 Tax=Glutamicibacter sp. BW78 TaxID=2024403 RepID=UPI000BB7650C|nr:hypothetical protein [Glutamicibacter sp. BW78]PCC24727.1 hypothetical protein CIK75_11150 [Glutamicibacter sp. BW78]